MKTYDVMVVGSGIAGLSFALKVAARGRRVAIITKKDQAESNTNYAQGGIAAVTSQTDDFELHVADTLTAGDGLCREEVVRDIVSAGPERIAELKQIGVDFTQLDDGRISLHKEGGHSKRRILHVKDLTGAAIEAALLHAVAESEYIDVYEHHFAIDLITRRKLRLPGRDAVLGLYVLEVHSGEVHTFQAPVIMLATGGVGHVYQFTTNPDIATGDGIAIAYRAGVEVRNMEFIQFHPTALFTRGKERFLISEAVRGEGAKLRNLRGEAFMPRYDDRADLAPRDVVARAIDAEMKASGAEHMWLDITDQDADHIRERFPHIYEGCLKHGIDMTREMIPVVPACHYLCGGVTTSMSATTRLPGLLACGEVANTGLHGANRLASNSLLEACVLAHNGADSAEAYLENFQPDAITLPAWKDGDVRDPDERVVLYHNWDELKRTMWDYVAIVRTSKRLQRARTRIQNLQREINEYYWNFKVEPRLLELRNLIQVAELIAECALQRRESRGLHTTLDFPDKLDAAQDSILKRPRGS
ncbi:MAG: L-aspartate oxidase [Verrucomicrobiota bacterium]